MTAVTLSATAAVACYLLRFPLEAAGFRNAARAFWTAGCATLAVHISLAFALEHDWSHASAVDETARRTTAAFGIDSGAGVWVNYACLLIWAADVVRLWTRRAAPLLRGDAWDWTVQSFLALIVFFATVVFGSPYWTFPLAVAAVATFFLRRRRCTTAAASLLNP